MDHGADNYRRYLNGDDNGFVEIVKEYKNGLILYIESFVRNLTVAEELTEDTFVKLGIKKPRFSEKSSFRTWLYAIGRNIALDHIRKRSKTNTVFMDDCENLSDMESLENECIAEERKIVLHRRMNKLRTEYRQVLWLIYFEGFSIKETAEIMKKSKHNIETLSYRARQALKSELIKEGLNYEDL